MQSMAVVLAAGQGTRMKSDLPKVLQQACGRPLVDYVVDALESAGVSRIVAVVGYREELVREALSTRDSVEFAVQAERLGTGHAVQVCRDQLEGHEGPVVVLAGDSPLTQSASISTLLAKFSERSAACALGTLVTDRPDGLGRIVRDDRGGFAGIVEEKDATAEQRRIQEVNMSTYVFDCGELLHSLSQLRNANQQQEYYLTDCPGILLSEGKLVEAHAVLQPCEALSVNTLDELASVEAEMRRLGYAG